MPSVRPICSWVTPASFRRRKKSLELSTRPCCEQFPAPSNAKVVFSLALEIRLSYDVGMDTVPDIIETLGGSKAIADETGIPLTTVHSWKRARFVPSWRIPTLVLLAQKLGKPITEASFPSHRPVAVERAAA